MYKSTCRRTKEPAGRNASGIICKRFPTRGGATSGGLEPINIIIPKAPDSAPACYGRFKTEPRPLSQNTLVSTARPPIPFSLPAATPLLPRFRPVLPKRKMACGSSAKVKATIPWNARKRCIPISCTGLSQTSAGSSIHRCLEVL